MRCLAVDLGADSGRVILGTEVGAEIHQEVLHRFPNVPQRAADGSLHWDIEALWTGILAGLRLGAATGPIDSIAVDTWGVDYGLVDAEGNLLEAPYHYRDARTEGIADWPFYMAFGIFRLASISQGVYRRILGGNASTEREAINGTPALAEQSLEILRG